jgi:hypothetical protein
MPDESASLHWSHVLALVDGCCWLSGAAASAPAPPSVSAFTSFVFTSHGEGKARCVARLFPAALDLGALVLDRVFTAALCFDTDSAGTHILLTLGPPPPPKLQAFQHFSISDIAVALHKIVRLDGVCQP